MNAKKALNWLRAILKGTLVGLALVIPGVSGGSMLLTIGIYGDAVSITSSDKAVRRAAIKKLIPYALGIVLGVSVLSFVITWLLERYELVTVLAFVGLILGSLPMLVRQVRHKRFSVLGAVVFALMVALMIWLPYLNDTSSERFERLGGGDGLAVGERVVLRREDAGESLTVGKGDAETVVWKLVSPAKGLAKYKADVFIDGVLFENDDKENEFRYEGVTVPVWNTDGTLSLNGEAYWVYRAEDTLSHGFGSALLALLLGFIAAGTMIVPGISGSMVMLVLGYYHSIMGHLKLFIVSVLTANGPGILRHFTVLFPFGLGVLLGLLFVSKLVKWLLDKHPVPTYYGIIGLMLSSPYAIFVKATCFGAGFAASLTPLTVILSLVCLGGGFFLASRMNTEE